MSWTRRIRVLRGMLALSLILAGSVAVAGDGDEVRRMHRRLLDREPTVEELAGALSTSSRARQAVELQARLLDSTEFRARVNDRSFLVGLFRAYHGRSPLLHEIHVGLHLLGEGLPRSELLVGLAREQPTTARSARRRSPRSGRIELDFREAALRRFDREAGSLLELAPDELRAALLDEAELLGGAYPATATTVAVDRTTSAEPAYDVYYGYLHAHTTVSLDAQGPGSGDPFEAYAHARDVAGLDFLGLSDHAEFISTWPWRNEWELLGEAADLYNDDGRFVALRGFEYSNPFYGHINVFGTDEFSSTWSRLTLRRFYEWLAEWPEAAATFNHPGNVDWLGIEFLHLALFPGVREQMVGIELLRHGGGYDEYSVGYVADDGRGHIDEANAAGWRIASVSAQDNHDGGWGTIDDFRTGVLATSLEREQILDALRARRFFSTEDRNLTLSFRSAGREMGAVVAHGPLQFLVRVGDADGEALAGVELYRAGRPIERRDASGADTCSFSVPAPGEPTWYYVVVTQEDGDRAMSAPIWVVGPDDDLDRP